MWQLRLGLVPLGFLHHVFDLHLREATLVIGYRDAVQFSSSLVRGGSIENAMVNIKGNFDLRNTTCGGDSR